MKILQYKVDMKIVKYKVDKVDSKLIHPNLVVVDLQIFARCALSNLP